MKILSNFFTILAQDVLQYHQAEYDGLLVIDHHCRQNEHKWFPLNTERILNCKTIQVCESSSAIFQSCCTDMDLKIVLPIWQMNILIRKGKTMWYKLLISAVILVFTHNQVFAKELFRSEFENGLLKYVGKSNRHPGGGFVGWLGGKVDSYYDPGDGCDSATSGKQNVNITSEAAAQGGPAGAQSSALKTFYRVFDNCGQSFQKNTTIIGIPQVPEVYVRFYQKWSSTWIWPTIQQKFAKIRNKDKTSTQNFYFKKDGVMEVSYVKLGKALSPNDPSDDDFPAGEIDMAINQWHEVQMHVKMSEPGKSNGMIEYWINGVQQFGLYDIENNNGSDVNTNGISHLELQHVYETGSPKSGPKQDMPTWMKNIVVSTTFIPSGGCPLCPKPPSNVQAVKK